MRYAFAAAGVAIFVLAGCGWGHSASKPEKSDKPVSAKEAAFLKEMGMDTVLDIAQHKATVGEAFVVQIGDNPITAGVMIDGSAWAPVSSIVKALGSTTDYDEHLAALTLTPSTTSSSTPTAPASGPADAGPAIKTTISDQKMSLAGFKAIEINVALSTSDGLDTKLAGVGITKDAIQSQVKQALDASSIPQDQYGPVLNVLLIFRDNLDGTVAYTIDLELLQNVRLENDLTTADSASTWSSSCLNCMALNSVAATFTSDLGSYLTQFCTDYHSAHSAAGR